MPSYSSATPFASVYHAPVMIDEILDQLDRLATKSTSAAPLARIIDLTCGGGGHSEAFLTYLRAQNLNHVEVIGVDRDSDSKEEASQRLKDFPNFHHCLKNFGDLTPDDLGGPVDFVLGDLGVSSHQIDDPSRGFRYGGNVKGGVAGPLDMRMDGNNGLSAADIVNDYPEEALLKILVDHGGEKYMSAKRIVAEIVRSRPMTRTDELTAAIERVTPKWSKSSPRKGALKTKARVFQAIRVAVNDEMVSASDGIDEGLCTTSFGITFC
ncbi:hypothetical protein TL16_g07122 [Triparma laevis f. inornata]|uniref:Uncharacterized protein n=1 Tax=Triparma laevis f. inornata TaxID=1714386 RepID=A0A9W7AWY7_9STRA|nr:hypothetical protein TL16_g07122 [Triparma laevis f. inornata]